MTPQQLVDKLASNSSEHSQQAALFAWSALPEVRATYPQLKWMFAVPNGFYSTAAQKAKMKAEGLKDGVPDIFLMWRIISVTNVNNRWNGLVMEMKAKNGRLSDEQVEWIKHLTSQGYAATVVKGFEAAKEVIINYLVFGVCP